MGALMNRALGKSGIKVSAMGLGCWAIGGPFWLNGKPDGWGFPADDFRGAGHEWLVYFENGRPSPTFMARLAAVREILTSQGRSLVQGALAWIWARSDKTIPIPGFKTVAQVEENCAAMALGPLTPAQMAEIEQLLRREAQPN